MYYFWNVQLAKKFEINEIKDNEWFSLSEKINGVRGTYYGGKIYSRQGNVISGLDHIISDIKKLNLPDMVFDGELVRDNVNNLSDNANFRLSNGIIQSNEKIKSEIKFVIFDMIPIKEFDQGKSNKKYKERLNDLLSINFQGSIEFVPIIYSGSDKSNIFNLLDKVVSEGKEGLILNRDTEYLRKRNSGILKVKKSYTMDLKIIQLEEGMGRLKGRLGAFVVEYKGSELRIGTGMTYGQRNVFWKLRDRLKGRIIEVKYSSESQDKYKNYSLQFPTFVQIRELYKLISYD